MNQIYNFYTHGETYKGEEMSRQMNAGLDVQSGTNDADTCLRWRPRHVSVSAAAVWAWWRLWRACWRGWFLPQSPLVLGGRQCCHSIPALKETRRRRSCRPAGGVPRFEKALKRERGKMNVMEIKLQVNQTDVKPSAGDVWVDSHSSGS